MKEIYIRSADGKKEFTITEDFEPYARGFYDCAAGLHDVVAALPKKSGGNLGFFFSDIGGADAFCDDDMPDHKKLFPAMIVSAPEGGKPCRITPVISFTGLFVYARFVPAFSRCKKPEPFDISSKIPLGRSAKLREELSGFCNETVFHGYYPSFTLRTLCGNEDVCQDRIISEIKDFEKRFSEIIDRFSTGSRIAPGTVLYKNDIPEAILNFSKKYDYRKIVADDPGLTLKLEQFFGRLPLRPQFVTANDFERLFATVPGLMKMRTYLGRTFYTGSGARIVYDKTEAMHVFDVNSADSEKSALDLNLESCEIIARAVSVKNLTGIIMCDFINMKTKENETAVISRMRELAGKDFRPFKIYGFTALKVLECSRNR